jgi:peptidoglycan/LPS O-acetylase OafA/YrhL
MGKVPQTAKRNLIWPLQWKDHLLSSIIMAASVAVDTFFTISGLLLVYLFMKSNDKGVKFSLPMFYLHRILR